MGGLAAEKPSRRLKVFFDGGCRPNPGKIEVAVVARGVTYFFDDLGWGTSSDAEWLALRMALKVAQSHKERKLLLHLMRMSKGNNGYGDGKRDRGRLFLSGRDAATAIGVCRNTAAKALQELIDHGFLRVVSKGHFDVKGVASTWRLTFQPYPHQRMGPSNEWRAWKPVQQKA